MLYGWCVRREEVVSSAGGGGVLGGRRCGGYVWMGRGCMQHIGERKVLEIFIHRRGGDHHVVKIVKISVPIIFIEVWTIFVSVM